MNVLITVVSDNHGHDETFGTKPNQPHLVYKKTISVKDGEDLLGVILQDIRHTIVRNLDTPIFILAKEEYPQVEGIRLRIADCEYVCQAVVGL